MKVVGMGTGSTVSVNCMVYRVAGACKSGGGWRGVAHDAMRRTHGLSACLSACLPACVGRSSCRPLYSRKTPKKAKASKTQVMKNTIPEQWWRAHNMVGSETF